MELSRRAFRRRVEEALAQVPEPFRPYLENIRVLVEEEPSEALLDELEVPEDETLFGLYTGTPLTERRASEVGAPELPGAITLYRLPLLEACEDDAELRREITITVLHEVAHHFGLDEARLEELGWG
jgi:predicted Zn-dependent protease with MMP-like domain